jgi:hypothetical protein
MAFVLSSALFHMSVLSRGLCLCLILMAFGPSVYDRQYLLFDFGPAARFPLLRDMLLPSR